MPSPRATSPISSRDSLRWRLPVLISTLIALVLGTFLWTAYRGAEDTLVRAAGERAQTAASQIADLLDMQRGMAQLEALTADADLQRFVATHDPDARERVRALFSRPTGTSLRRIEVWDTGGSLLLDLTLPGTSRRAGDASSLPPAGPPSTAGISPLQGADGFVFSDIVVAIHARDTSSSAAEGAAGPLGFVRVRLTISETPPGVFSRLVGHDAVVRIANHAGGQWTDLTRMLPMPDLDLTHAGFAQYTAPNGQRRIGAGSLVEGAPWTAWVDFPLAAIVAPARAFLTRMSIIALVFVAIGAALATALAGRITTPLVEISEAAAAVASGDYSRRVSVERRDEIGHLGRTFNKMAADVETGLAALRKSEESYRRLFAGNPHPMWIYDAKTLRFLDVNDAAVAQYGYSRDEFLAMTIKDIRPANDVPALIEHAAHLGPGAEGGHVWKHRRKDGTIIDVDVSSHELTLDGRAARVVLAHDVTEALRAQRALRESEALFRGMAETMPHIVWTARPDGQIEYLNRQWSDYTGLSFEETLRGGWHSTLHPDDVEAAVERHRRALETGAAYETLFRLRHRNGAYRWHVGRTAPLTNEDGAIVMWVGTSTDVDDTMRAAEAMKTLNAELESRVESRTRDLEEANRELEAFSYSVSHDLRAPLRHVQGYVEMLTASTEGQLAEKPRRYLKVITDATVEMGELIDDLLAFSRVSRAQMSEGRVPLDLIVRASIEALEMATRERNIVWRIGALPQVIGDPALLKIVFANLIGNAVKYSRYRDPAVIEIGVGGEEDGRVILFVRDNGAGFDMRYAHKLFGVFQRLHRSDEFEGTGIGLATVRRIINRHGGRTWAEGKVDEGATIYLTLAPAAGLSS